MTDVEYRSFMNLLMCSDPYPTTDNEEQVMKNLANREAQKRGYEDWIIAYHEYKIDVS